MHCIIADTDILKQLAIVCVIVLPEHISSAVCSADNNNDHCYNVKVKSALAAHAVT